MKGNRIYLGIGAIVFLFVLLACAEAGPRPFLWGLGSPPRRVHGGNRPRPPLVAAHGPPHHPPHPHPAHHHHHGQLPLPQRPIHHPHAPHGVHGPLPLTG